MSDGGGRKGTGGGTRPDSDGCFDDPVNSESTRGNGWRAWLSSLSFSIGSDTTRRRPPSPASVIAHLRDVLGDQTYESLARKGEAMTPAAMATYAYDQIDQARAELNAVSK